MTGGLVGIVFRGGSAYGGFGSWVSGLGDVNKDGRGDFAIGTASAVSYAVWGQATFTTPLTVSFSSSDLPSSAFQIFSSRFFQGAAGGGDVNGDGVDDIATPADWGSTVAFGSIWQTPLSSFSTIDNGQMYGSVTYKVALSDLNGDGLQDVVIARPGSAGWDQIQIDVHLGAANLFYFDSVPDATFSVPGYDGAATGYGLAGGGDFNGDGLQDLVVSTDSGSSPGAAWVIYGKAAIGTLSSLQLGSLGASQGVKLVASSADYRFGQSAAFIGDYNGDGLDDVAIGSGEGNGTRNYVHVALGSAAPATERVLEDFGDLNTVGGTDHFGFLANGGSVVYEPPNQAQEYAFAARELATPMSAAGDVNGDGRADFLVGAPGASVDGKARAGEAYLVFGESRPAGWDFPDLYGGAMFSPSLTYVGGYRFVGENAGDLAGYSVAGVGDVNGDGYADFMIGAPGADDVQNGTDAGKSYLIYGGTARLKALDEMGGVADGVIALADVGAGFSLPPPDAVDDHLTSTLSPDSGGYLYFDSAVLANDKSAAGAALRIVSVDRSGLDGALLYLYPANPYQSLLMVRPYESAQVLALKPGETMVQSFGYTVEDEFGGRDSATATITFIGVNDSPVALPDTILRRGNAASYTLNVLANDHDPEGDAMSVTAVSAPLYGSVQFAADGTLTYTPGADRKSADVFSYSITDPAGRTATTQVQVPALGHYAGLTLVGESLQAHAGNSVAAAGDFNGDGVGDVVVGSPGFFPGATLGAGAAYVVFGSAQSLPASLELSGLDGKAGLILQGSTPFLAAGNSVAGIGDLNGDGFDDVLVGTGKSYPAGDGDAYVVFGSADGLPRSLALETLDGSNGFRLQRDASRGSDLYFSSVSSAGDVNGDGLDDLLVGMGKMDYAPLPDQNGATLLPQTGSAFVVYGTKAGFAATLRLDELPATRGMEITSSAAAGAPGLGQTVAGGGDFNGDGFDDIVVSGSQFGQDAYLIYGRATPPGDIDLANLQPEQGFRFARPTNFSAGYVGGFGAGLSLSADINGDGFDDLMVGAPHTGNFAGAAFVVYGTDQKLGSVLDGNTLNGSNGFSITGLAAQDQLGTSLAGAGDVNGDGIDDFIVSAPMHYSGSNAAGAAYVVYGRTGGFGSAFDLRTLNGKNGFVVQERAELSSLGRSVSAAGDVNGDGIDDLAIGAYTADPDAQRGNAGEVYILFGGTASIQAADGLDGSVDGVIRPEALALPQEDDAPGPHAFSVASPGSVAEGDSGTTLLNFVVTRGGSLSGSVTVNYSIGGSASSADATTAIPATGSITFGDQVASQTISIGIKGDLQVEPDETVVVALTGGTAVDKGQVQFLDGSATSTIVNDDKGATVSVGGGGSLTEPDTGTAPLTFTITRAGGLKDGVTVEYTVSGTGPRPVSADDLATPLNATGSVHFGPNETAKTVTVQVRGDEAVEYDETLQLTITKATHDAGGADAAIKTASARATVLNDDVKPTVTASAPGAVAEGISHLYYDYGEHEIQVMFNRTGDLDSAASVDYYVSTSTLAPRYVPVYLNTIERWGGVTKESWGMELVTDAVTFAEEAQGGDTSYQTKPLTLGFGFAEKDVEEFMGVPADKSFLLGFELPIFKDSFSISGQSDTFLDFDYLFAGDVGLTLRMAEIGLGSLKMDYDVAAGLNTPYFVPAGQAFAIVPGKGFHSAGGTMDAESLSFGGLSLDLDLSMQAPAGKQLGFTNIEPIDFFGVTLFDPQQFVFDSFEDQIPLIALGGPSGSKDIEGLLPELVDTFGGLSDEIHFEIGLPEGEQESATFGAAPAGVLQDAIVRIEEPLAKVTFDVLEILAEAKHPLLKWLDALSEEVHFGVTDLGPPPDYEPIYRFEAQYTALNLLVSAGYGIVQEYKFHPTGVKTEVTYAGLTQTGMLGDEFGFVAPANVQGVQTGSVKYSLQGTMDVVYKIAPIGSIEVNVGSIEVSDKNATLFDPVTMGPLWHGSISGSTDFGSFELFSFENIVMDDFFEPITQDFIIASGKVPEDTVLFGTVNFLPGEAQKILRLPLMSDLQPEPDVQVTITLDNPQSKDGTDLQLATEQLKVKVIDDDVFMRFRMGWGWGDPHYSTLDGLSYAFQAAGEFTLAESVGADQAPLLVQVRTAPVGNSDLVSANTAFATRVGSARVSIDLATPGHLLVNGVATALQANAAPLAVGDGQVAFDGVDYTILYATGETAIVTPHADYLDISLGLMESRAGKLRGLLGNGDGDAANDLQLPDGTVLAQPVDYGVLYGAFANSWRVSDATSLFTYAPGGGTADYQDLSFPRGQISLQDIPADVLATATALVDAMGITDPIVRQAAILDVAMTGNPDYAKSAAEMAAPPSASLVVTGTPALPATVGISAAQTSVLEGDDAYVEAEFVVYRMGGAVGELQVSYSLGGEIDAADLMPGQATSGTVTFADGETSAVLRVDVKGDSTAELDEQLVVTIGLPQEDSGVLIAAPHAATTVRNDDGPLPVQFSLTALEPSQAEGDGTDTVYRFRVERSGNTLVENQVQLAVLAGTASAADFAGGTLPATMLAFAPGETSKTFHVAVAGDHAIEADEVFTVALNAATAQGPVALSVAATIVNDDFAPIVQPDQAAGAANATLSGNLLANDSTQEAGAVLSVQSVNGLTAAVGQQIGLPSGALLTVGADGQYLYDPHGAFDALGAGKAGTDAFTYVVTDGVHTAGSTVTVTLAGVNEAPVPEGDDAKVAANGTLSFNLLQNDHDVDGDALHIVSVFGDAGQVGDVLTRPSGALLILDADGTLHYATNGAFAGLAPGETKTETVVYKLSDGTASVQSTLTITIEGVAQANQAPVAADDGFAIAKGQQLGGNLFADNGHGADKDGNGDVLTVATVNGAAFVAGQAFALVSGALLTVDANGQFHYDPAAFGSGLKLGQVGRDAFAYSVGDGHGGTDTAVVRIVIDAGSETATIGSAPARLTSSTQNAWTQAWSHAAVELTHKADVAGSTEAWTPVSLANASATTLAGSDIYLGDLGVSGQTLATGTVRQEIDGTEGLRFGLGKAAVAATLGLERFFLQDDATVYAEAGRWQAFDAAGALVAQDYFFADSAGGSRQLMIEVEQGFRSLVLTAGAFNGSSFVPGAYATPAGAYGSAPVPAGTALKGSDYLVDAASFEFAQVAVLGAPALWSGLELL